MAVARSEDLRQPGGDDKVLLLDPQQHDEPGHERLRVHGRGRVPASSDADKKIGAGVKTPRSATTPSTTPDATWSCVPTGRAKTSATGSAWRCCSQPRRGAAAAEAVGAVGAAGGAGAEAAADAAGVDVGSRPPLSARESHRDVCLRTTRAEAALERAPLPARFRKRPRRATMETEPILHPPQRRSA